MAETPKLLICSNFYPKGATDSYVRRRKLFELSRHYNKNHKPMDEPDVGMLFDDDPQEWHRFDTFMLKCVQMYLQEGALVESGATSAEERMLNTEINEDFRTWFEECVYTEAMNIFGKGKVVFDLYCIDKRYSNWYHDEYGTYPTVLPRRKKTEWIRMLCEASTPRLEMSSRMVTKRVDATNIPILGVTCGRTVKVWEIRKKADTDLA